MADKIMKPSRTYLHNSSETVENKGFDKEIHKQRCISPEERQKTTD